MRLIRFLGTEFAVGDRRRLLAWLDNIVYHRCTSTVIMHVNLNTIYISTKVSQLKRAIDLPGNLVLFEGIALKVAAFLTSARWWPDVNGTDLVPLFLGMHPNRTLRLALVGGRPGVAEKAGRMIAKRLHNITIVDTLDGFADLSDIETALARVRLARPDVLLIGLGTPLQEITSTDWSSSVTIPLIWTVGGLFDLWAGLRQRAPPWVRACRLEWLWRFVHEPAYRPRVLIQGAWLLRQVITIWNHSKDILPK